MITYAFDLSWKSRGLSWLPAYHDMGLIGGLLAPLYTGCFCVFMSPMAFLQKPIRWLKAISRYKITISGGPNFAYDLCSQQITEEQMESLNLSSWCLAYNGAEPIRSSTLGDFSRKFEEVGFNSQACYPCYGMAEATSHAQNTHTGQAFHAAASSRPPALGFAGAPLPSFPTSPCALAS